MATEKPSPPFGTKKFNRQLQRPAGESPLVGGRPTPLKNLKVSWEGLSHILWENKTCSKPPSSIYIIYIYIDQINFRATGLRPWSLHSSSRARWRLELVSNTWSWRDGGRHLRHAGHVGIYLEAKLYTTSMIGVYIYKYKYSLATNHDVNGIDSGNYDKTTFLNGS